MYGIGDGSQESQKDVGLLFHEKYTRGELIKNGEFMDSDHHHQQQQQQQQQQSSGLIRYRSAPSSFFANVLNGSGVGCDDFLDHRSSEAEPVFGRFSSGGLLCRR
ncbi:hypothetical protein L1049_010878 [Liquidambar formosana]|uniref:Uncharacterized protein n=1 Tax=Liquidambar formosana TaxID=63359 RepID=A0AAP0RRE6_LIQFO